MNNNILFGSINLPILDKALAAKEILKLPDSLSWWDDYRGTKMIPLSTRDGLSGRVGASNYRKNPFEWTDYAPECIREWFDQIVFPWIGQKSRVIALITQPHFSNNEHIDCNRHELHTMQHKFRIVVQGDTDTLYFKTKVGDVFVPNINGPFLMDGAWPHGMKNNSNVIKVTLALGAPWRGNETYSNFDTLMYRSDYEMPDDIESFWKKEEHLNRDKQDGIDALKILEK
jgi:hypothetical protein